MSDILGIAVSGLTNAAARLANAASSMVNASSTQKIPQKNSSLNTPASGGGQAANVDLNADLIASKEAEISYDANAKVITIADKMQKSLIDALK